MMRAHLWRISVVIALTATLAVVAPGRTAVAADGTVTGTLTSDDTGFGIFNIRVWICEVAGSCFTGDLTAGDGTWSASVAPGDYTVQFLPASFQPYVAEYWDDALLADDATIVTVTDGVTTVLDASLESARFIRGTLTVPGGAPAPLVRVTACETTIGLCRQVFTDTDGTYEVYGLPAGMYTLWFAPTSGLDPYIAEYWDDQPTIDTATIIDLTAATSADDTDAEIAVRSSVSGTVTDADGGAGVGGALVEICAGDDSGCFFETTAADGTYLRYVDEGDYWVRFGRLPEDGYETRYYDQALTQATATVITVDGAMTGIDAQLQRDGIIEGRVTGTSGEPLFSTLVRACPTSGQDCTEARTDADGFYANSAAPGPNRVTFYRDAPYLDQSWPGLNGVVDAGDPIEVVSDVTVSDIDAVLVRNGSITGRVVDEFGAPLEGVFVDATSASTGGRSTGFTDADGNYETDPTAPADDWIVEFDEFGYDTTFFDGAGDPAAATPVTVVDNQATPDIDATLTVTSSLRGTVRGPDGQPLAGIAVVARLGESGGFAGLTDDAGRYFIANVPAGDYLVRFSDDSNEFLDEYHDDVYLSADATRVPIAGNDSPVVLDATLGRSSTVSGHVTFEEAPAEGVFVRLCTAPNTCEFTTTTEADGSYSVTDVPPGDWLVRFEADRPAAAEFWPGVFEPSAAEAITTTGAGGTVGDIDAHLRTGGTIAGNVTDAEGEPLFPSQVVITACSATIDDCLSAFPTQLPGGTFDGTYEITGLPPASDYVVSFEDPSGTRATEWWCDTEVESEALAVQVRLGETVEGIDASTRRLSDPDHDSCDAAVFVTQEPQRFADSRDQPTFDGEFRNTGAREGGSTWEIDIAGRGGIPADAAAAVVNVTLVGGAGPGFATVHPCAAERPEASSVNYTTGSVDPNEVVAKLSPAGTICVFTQTTADVVVDVVGHVPANSPYVALEPARYADSRDLPTFDGDVRDTGARRGGSTWEIPIAGRGGVPVDADSAVVNVTVTGASGPGFATVHPCSPTRPEASSLNYDVGVTRPNELVAKLSPTGTICVFTQTTVEVVVDVVGFVQPSPALVSLEPTRYADSRDLPTFDGRQRNTTIRRSGTTWEIPVAGRGAIPADASTVVANLTVTGATGPGFATVFPCTEQPPGASSLNYVAGDTRPNELVAQLSTDGSLCVFTQTATHVVVDITGYG